MNTHTLARTKKIYFIFASLLTLGSLLLFSGLAIILAQFFLPANQDIRNQAMVPDGISELSLVPGSGNLTMGAEQQIAIKLNTKSSKIYGVQLKFNVITNGTIGALQATFNKSIALNELYSKVEKTNDGYLVTFAGVPKTVSSTAYYANNEPTTLLTLAFTPTKEGTIAINFDTENTKTKSFETNSVDQLKTIGQTTYNVREVAGLDLSKYSLSFAEIKNWWPTAANSVQQIDAAIWGSSASSAEIRKLVNLNADWGFDNAYYEVTDIANNYHDSCPIKKVGKKPCVVYSAHVVTKKYGKSSVKLTLSSTNGNSIWNSEPAVIDNNTGATPVPTATPTPPSAPAVQSDDLYFAPLTEERMKFFFYEKGSSVAVPDSQLTKGKWYTLKHTTYVLSTKKSDTQDLRTVGTKVSVNGNASVTKNIAYSDFTSKDTGLGIPFEVNFIAEDINTVTLTADSTNTIAEKSEDNNKLTAEFKHAGVTANKSCNEICSSNSDCPADFRCYNTGSDSRCRLVVNVTNTSCNTATNQTNARGCNQYCADTSECAAGYSCWYNKCRNPKNLESTSCTATTAQATTTVYTQSGCNVKCATSRDCQAGLRCFAGACRHPLNTSDVSCSPYTAGGNLSGTKGEEKPLASSTPKPTPSSTPQPEATTSPIPSYTPFPTAAPTESAYDFLRVLFGYSFAQVAAMKLWGVQVSTIAIGAGIVLLLISILLIALLGRRRRNYVPPTLTTPQESTPSIVSTAVAPNGEASPQTPLATEIHRGQQQPPHDSMVDRLKQKGVSLPPPQGQKE